LKGNHNETKEDSFEIVNTSEEKEQLVKGQDKWEQVGSDESKKTILLGEKIVNIIISYLLSQLLFLICCMLWGLLSGNERQPEVEKTEEMEQKDVIKQRDETQKRDVIDVEPTGILVVTSQLAYLILNTGNSIGIEM
jgi:hypothetical protein